MSLPRRHKGRRRQYRERLLAEMNTNEKAVFEIIQKHDEDNPVPGDDIALAVGLDVREVRSIVRTLRMKYFQPVGSRTQRGHGYWMMRWKHEAMPIYKSLWQRGWAIVRMAYKMKIIANSLPDFQQPSLTLSERAGGVRRTALSQKKGKTNGKKKS